MDILLSITTAFLVSFSAIPIVIRVFISLNLLDTPDHRKIHTVSTPSLGGIAIFVGFVIALAFWVPMTELANFKFFLLAMLLSFILGVRDDISSLQALDKLTTQVFSALLVIFFADIKFSGLYGILGMDQLPVGVAEFISLFVIIGLTNAYNLIDGIDGLAGSIALLVFGCFGYWFFLAGHDTLGFFSITLLAATLGFLFFNWAPAKIFMGDTGSMVLGFAMSVLMIQFIDLNANLPRGSEMKLTAPVGMAFALLVLPIYDMLRVFLIRILSGRSPMSADKNHTHHILLKLGLSHSTSTFVLIGFNMSAIAIASTFQSIGNNWLSLLILVLSISFGAFLDFRLKKKIQNIRKESVSTY